MRKINEEKPIETGQSTVETTAPDGGWGWMVVFAAFFLNLLNGGIFSVQGMLYEEFLRHYTLTVTGAAWLISLQAGLCYVGGLFNGPFLAVMSERSLSAIGSLMIVLGMLACAMAPNVACLFMSFSILSGLGMSMQCLPSSVLVQNYFDKYRPLAASVALSGGSMGVFVFPPIARALTDEYGWRGMVILLSGVLLNSVPLALLLRPLPRKFSIDLTNGDGQGKPVSMITKLRSSLKNIFNLSILKTKAPWVTISVYFLAYCGISGVYTSVTVKCTGLNFPKKHAPYLISVMGISETVGRVLSGVIGNIKCVNRTYLFCAGILLCGVSSVISGFVTSFPLLLVYGAMYGLNVGVFVGLGITIVVDLMGKLLLPYVLGFNLFAGGIGNFIALPILALSLDASGNHAVPFVILGTCFILASGTLLTFYQCQTSIKPQLTEHKKTVYQYHKAEVCG